MVGLAVTTTIVLLVASLANAAPASKTKESYVESEIQVLSANAAPASKTKESYVESEIQVVSARIKKSRAILHDIYDDLKTIGKRVKDFDINMERLTVNVTALDTFYSNFQWTPVRQITGTAATGGATGSVAMQDIRDCTDVLASGNTQSGVYSVNLASQESPTRLYCRMEGDDAWNIIQRRSDDSVDFDRSWDTYKNGFGDLEGSFWLGNDNIHLLTNQGQYRLRVRLESGNTQSGVYSVNLASQESPTRLYCRMEGDDAWNIIQRRSDDSVDFDRSWDTYKNGFGDLEGSFWLGNDNIHLLTNQGQYRLRVRLERFNGQSAHADYDLFRIKDEENKYQLEIGYFTGGGAGDCLFYHAYMSFSTCCIKAPNAT
uniref:Fibrinogen C-terminal domain-containing protein n=1 Tax=Branchiostoma floridae TaxID=7739 RepID=C3YQJ5_BRAFL|eukprot:XP_002601339.1 hypothetical protein BRAFLDRAFT_123237 [Branchiostoma floridae]